MKRYRYTILFSAIFVICLFLTLNRIRIDSGYMVFLPGYSPRQGFESIQNENVRSLLEVSKTFSDGAQIVVIAKASETFLEPSKVKRLAELQKELSNLQSVKSVVSILNYPFKQVYFDGSTLSKEILNDPESRNFISADGKYVLLNCILKPTNDFKFDPQIVKEIRKALSSYGDLSPLLFGEAVINYYLFQEIICFKRSSDSRFSTLL